MLTGDELSLGHIVLMLIRGHSRHRGIIPLVHPRIVGHGKYGRYERTMVSRNHGPWLTRILVRTSISKQILLLILLLIHQRRLRLHFLHFGLLL